MSTKVAATPIHWNADTEVCLFYAMRGHKPVGINKHFHMMCIHKKFSTALGQTVQSNQIWEHLQTMYNLPALDESEGFPFSTRRTEFNLPSYVFNIPHTKEKKESVSTEETPPPAKLSSKHSRKRNRTLTNASNPGSPATIPVKRKR